MLEAVLLPTPALPDQPTPHTSAHQAWARTQLLSKMASLPTVSEGRRDQCEAPSDPKFPDCAGKVEVRPGAEGGGGDQPGVSSETVLLAGLSTGQGPSAQPQPLTLALGGKANLRETLLRWGHLPGPPTHIPQDEPCCGTFFYVANKLLDIRVLPPTA